MELAGVFGFSRSFSPNLSVWSLTAAQRAVLLGPDRKAKKAPKKLGLDKLRELTLKHAAQLLPDTDPEEIQ